MRVILFIAVAVMLVPGIPGLDFHKALAAPRICATRLVAKASFERLMDQPIESLRLSRRTIIKLHERSVYLVRDLNNPVVIITLLYDGSVIPLELYRQLHASEVNHPLFFLSGYSHLVPGELQRTELVELELGEDANRMMARLRIYTLGELDTKENIVKVFRSAYVDKITALQDIIRWLSAKRLDYP